MKYIGVFLAKKYTLFVIKQVGITPSTPAKRREYLTNHGKSPNFKSAFDS